MGEKISSVERLEGVVGKTIEREEGRKNQKKKKKVCVRSGGGRGSLWARVGEGEGKQEKKNSLLHFINSPSYYYVYPFQCALGQMPLHPQDPRACIQPRPTTYCRVCLFIAKLLLLDFSGKNITCNIK